MMATMMNYLWTLPFDVERFTLIIQDHIDDEDINTYLDALLHDYDKGDEVDETEARSVLYDKAYPIFTMVFDQYYSNAYIHELIHHSEEDINISTQLGDVLQQPTWNTIKQWYIQQIQSAFDSYDSGDARRSLIRWAQKILVEELIQNWTHIWQSEEIGVWL